jgi:hypothetical protein
VLRTRSLAISSPYSFHDLWGQRLIGEGVHSNDLLSCRVFSYCNDEGCSATNTHGESDFSRDKWIGLHEGPRQHISIRISLMQNDSLARSMHRSPVGAHSGGASWSDERREPLLSYAWQIKGKRSCDDLRL